MNGEDHAKVFGKAANFIEREDGKDQSALMLRDVALSQARQLQGAGDATARTPAR